MIPDPHARRICLPVVLRDGKWLLENGLPLPRLRDEAYADLWVQAIDFDNEAESKVWSAELKVPFLPSGTTLSIGINRNDVPAKLRPFCKERSASDGRSICSVEVHLLRDVKLILTPGKQAMLGSCLCRIPSLDRDVASINEAYTRVSEAFEPKRRSHTGNVFRKVFRDCVGFIEPLDKLRKQVERQARGPAAAPAPQRQLFSD